MARVSPKVLDEAKVVLGITTDKDLAKAIGINPATLSYWRRGEKKPNVINFIEFTRATGIHYSKLIIDDEEISVKEAA